MTIEAGCLADMPLVDTATVEDRDYLLVFHVCLVARCENRLGNQANIVLSQITQYGPVRQSELNLDILRPHFDFKLRHEQRLMTSCFMASRT